MTIEIAISSSSSSPAMGASKSFVLSKNHVFEKTRKTTLNSSGKLSSKIDLLLLTVSDQKCVGSSSAKNVLVSYRNWPKAKSLMCIRAALRFLHSFTIRHEGLLYFLHYCRRHMIVRLLDIREEEFDSLPRMCCYYRRS